MLASANFLESSSGSVPGRERASPFDQFITKMNDSKARMRLYALCAAGLYVIAILLMMVKVRHGVHDRLFDFAPSDGKYYYVYIVAAVKEGSLDPGPALRHWGYKDDSKIRDSRGRDLNPYPIGISLTVAPSFFIADVLSKIAYAITHSPRFEPDGYTIIYQLLNLAWVMTLSWATFVMLDRLMVHYFGLSGVAAAIGVLGGWIGTQYTYHLIRFPLMSHVFGPFWATALVYCAAGAVEKIERSREVGWQWAGMTLCLSMAIVCRNTNLIWGVAGIYPLYLLIRSGLLPKLARQIPWIALGLVPVILQMLVWHNQFGHFIAKSYGDSAIFYWTHPAFWQIMFSARAGMLVWCPVWTMGLIGAILYSRSRPRGSWIVAVYLLSFLLIWYVNSAFWCWPSGNYPNRMFAEWIGLPTIGLGLLFQNVWSSRFRTQCLIALLIAGVCGTWLMSFAYDARKVRRYGDEVNAMGSVQARFAR